MILWLIGLAGAADTPPGCEAEDWPTCAEQVADLDDGPLRRELLARSCTEGEQADSCRRLGYMAEEARGGPRDNVLALQSFEAACDGGDGGGCLRAGLSLSYGFSGTLDYAESAVRYQQGCDLDNGTCCNNLGVLHKLGRGTQVDEDAARSLYQTGCDAGSKLACNNLGRVLPRGSSAADDAFAAAHAIVEADCADGSRSACVSAASDRYQGRGVARQRRPALEELRALCDADEPYAWACTTWAALQLDGPEDKWPSSLVETLERACDLESGSACSILGASAVDRGDLEGALARLTRGCELGNAGSCERLGELHLLRKVASADPEAAVQALWTGCLDLRSGSCALLASALHLGHASDPERETASALLRSACDDGRGCAMLSTFTRMGRIGPPDIEEALAIAKRACEDGDSTSCNQLGRLAADLRMAPEIELAALERSCEELGDPTGCALYGTASKRLGHLGQARDALQEGCREGSARACGELAEMFATGTGATHKPDKARELTEAACEAGDHASCLATWRTVEEP